MIIYQWVNRVANKRRTGLSGLDVKARPGKRLRIKLALFPLFPFTPPRPL